MFRCVGFGCTRRTSVQVLEFISLSLFFSYFYPGCVLRFVSHTALKLAQLRGEWVAGEGKGKSGDAYVGTAAKRSDHHTIPSVSTSQICTTWSPTPPHGRAVKINILTVLRYREKRTREIRSSCKKPTRNSGQFWNVTLAVIVQHLNTAHVPVCTSQDIPLCRVS